MCSVYETCISYIYFYHICLICLYDTYTAEIYVTYILTYIDHMCNIYATYVICITYMLVIYVPRKQDIC